MCNYKKANLAVKVKPLALPKFEQNPQLTTSKIFVILLKLISIFLILLKENCIDPKHFLQRKTCKCFFNSDRGSWIQTEMDEELVSSWEREVQSNQQSVNFPEMFVTKNDVTAHFLNQVLQTVPTTVTSPPVDCHKLRVFAAALTSCTRQVYWLLAPTANCLFYIFNNYNFLLLFELTYLTNSDNQNGLDTCKICYTWLILLCRKISAFALLSYLASFAANCVSLTSSVAGLGGTVPLAAKTRGWNML